MITIDVAAAPDLGADLDTDPAVRPQDDFYRHVNGRWADAFALPAHRAEVTLLGLLAEKVQADVVGLIRGDGAARSDGDPHRRQIADLYASFMDEEALAARSADALGAVLAAIDAAPDHWELARVMGRLQGQGWSGAVELSVTTDTTDAQRYVLNLTQSGLGLPEAALYSRAGSEPLRARYAQHLRTIFALAGYADAEGAAAAALRLETELAAGHAAPDRAGRLSGAPLRFNAARLAVRTGGFPWHAWLEGLRHVPDAAIVELRPASFTDTLDDWWSGHDLADLKHWLSWLFLHEMAPFGPPAVYQENFAFYGQTLTGSTSSRPRWMRAVSFVQTVAGDAVGERYCRERLTGTAVDQARGIVDALTRTYRARLAAASWMHPRTQAAAVDKLDRMVFEIGRPAAPAAGELPAFDPADLAGNVARGRERRVTAQLRRLCGPVDRSDWRVPPQAATAYYRHGLNQVVVPAALLQQPFFDPGDAARSFALLGSIVAHEMSHAFDSRGAQYDGEGRIRNWWAPEDLAEYTRRGELLVEQYDRYGPEGPDGPRVSGARTLGENIADITGLAVAQAAFAEHLAEQGLDRAERDHRMRRFFALWASMWRVKRTRGRMLERLAADRHAPSEFRCNGVLGHIPAFYQAFSVAPGDAMHIDPDRRFTLL